MSFYTFQQNNSGGSFHFEKGKITQNVIIEANSNEQAISIAESVGIYFNGVSEGRDCECCGDRWYDSWYDEGTEQPQLYGQTMKEYQEDRDSYSWMGDNPSIYVHYLDGTTDSFG